MNKSINTNKTGTDKKFRDVLKKKIDKKYRSADPLSKIKQDHNQPAGQSKSAILFQISCLAVIIASVVYVADHFFTSYLSDSKTENLTVKKEKKPESVSDSIKKENERFDLESHSEKTETDLVKYTKEDLNEMRQILANYDISDSIRKKAKNPEVSMNDLYRYKGDSFKILNEREKSLILNGYETGRGFQLNKYGVVYNVVPYTEAWRTGLKNYDKLSGINNSPVNSNAKLNDVYNALFDPRYQVINWQRPSKRQLFNTSSFKNEPLFGDLAESYIMNDVLILRIKKITSYTPALLYHFISADINKFNGIIIDLRNLEDQSYIGIPELSWLFNGQQITKIAEVTDHNEKTSSLNSKPVNFQTKPEVLAKLNQTGRIVLVNNKTSGSPEILIRNISKAKVIGTATAGNDKKDNFYNAKAGIVKLTNNIVRDNLSNPVLFFPEKNGYIPVDRYYGSLVK